MKEEPLLVITGRGVLLGGAPGWERAGGGRGAHAWAGRRGWVWVGGVGVLVPRRPGLTAGGRLMP